MTTAPRVRARRKVNSPTWLKISKRALVLGLSAPLTERRRQEVSVPLVVTPRTLSCRKGHQIPRLDLTSRLWPATSPAPLATPDERPKTQGLTAQREATLCGLQAGLAVGNHNEARLHRCARWRNVGNDLEIPAHLPVDEPGTSFTSSSASTSRSPDIGSWLSIAAATSSATREASTLIRANAGERQPGSTPSDGSIARSPRCAGPGAPLEWFRSVAMVVSVV